MTENRTDTGTRAATYDCNWQEAMRVGDVAALRRLLLPEAVVVHHDGRVETGSVYLDRIEHGGLPFVAFAMEEGQVRVLDGAMVITGRMEATVDHDGSLHSLVATVTRTWVRAGSGWALIAITSSGH